MFVEHASHAVKEKPNALGISQDAGIAVKQALSVAIPMESVRSLSGQNPQLLIAFKSRADFLHIHLPGNLLVCLLKYKLTRT